LSRPGFEHLDGPDATKDSLRGTADGHAESQLNNHTDISKAHGFFQPRGNTALPDFKLHGGEGPLLAPKATPPAMMQPGGEPVSPLVQMIMKLPGLTGVMSSFFELLGAILHGNLLDALNPANWAEHAGEAMTALEGSLEHLNAPVDALNAQTPALHLDGQSLTSTASAGDMQLHHETLASSAAAEPENLGTPIAQPDLKQAAFERADDVSNLHQNAFWNPIGRHDLALGDGHASVYTPHSGGMYQPSSSTAATASATNASSHGTAGGAAGSAHAGEHGLSFRQLHRVTSHHMFQAPEAPRIADKATSNLDLGGEGKLYTVHQGDNLWKIAGQQLGDPSRWREIYQVNANAIGANPNLIQSGLNLKMPGFSANQYVVQRGDNLWNIAQHQLGGGQRWADIYRANHLTIGANPNLLHPGQHLNLGSAGKELIARQGNDAS
jgi:LysM repeat protein